MILFLIFSIVAYQKILSDDYKTVYTDTTNCLNTRWGCCYDNLTPRLDPDGTNCI